MGTEDRVGPQLDASNTEIGRPLGHGFHFNTLKRQRSGGKPST